MQITRNEVRHRCACNGALEMFAPRTVERRREQTDVDDRDQALAKCVANIGDSVDAGTKSRRAVGQPLPNSVHERAAVRFLHVDEAADLRLRRISG
jgi:hypothetical protein